MKWREYQALERVTVIGQRFISYAQQGSGDPLILIHGIPTWGFLWHGLLPTLARTHAVYVPDMIGFGYSDKTDAFDRSIAAQTEILLRWMDTLGLERAAVAGHDIGGGVALRLAAFHPGRVSRLAVINSVCYDSWPVEMMLQLGHPGSWRIASAATTFKALKRALKMGFASPPDGEVLDGLLAPYSTEAGKLSLIRNAAALNTNLTTEITPELPKIRMPTLILWGEEDRFQPVRYGERLARDIPGSRLVRIKHARHFVMFDARKEIVRHLSEFLESRETRAA